MALTEIGRPFQGVIFYSVEDTFGGGMTATELPVSKYVQNVRIGTGDKHAPLRGFDSPLVKTLMMQTTEPELHVEYNPQCDDTLMMDCANRGSCCTLKSLAFVIGISTCLTESGDPDNASYYEISGCKPSTVRISSTHNAPYTVSIDFLAKSIVTIADASASIPSELTGVLLQFNVAGEIIKSGGNYVITKAGGDRFAFITNSIEVTIENQLTSYSDHDSLVKDYIVEGTLDVSGSVDISLDGGGAAHIQEVLDQTDFGILIHMGGTGCPQIVLPGCKWKNGDVTGDVGGEAVMSSCPFTSVPTDCETLIVTA